MSAGCGQSSFCISAALFCSSNKVGHSAYLQASLNKRQHSLNGNTVIKLADCIDDVSMAPPRVISLFELLPFQNHQVPALDSHGFLYSREVILRHRSKDTSDDLLKFNLQQTTPPHTIQTCCKTRSGKRRVCFTLDGAKTLFKHRSKSLIQTVNHNSRIHNSHSQHSRSPPPRGTPGAY